MPKFSFSAYPHLLGFDALEQMLESSVKTNSDGFPPYNIEQLSEDHFRIVLAVAGFSIDDLSVVVEGPKLVISGKQAPNSSDFVHQGISARQFTRIFVLADCIETTGSRLLDGLLTVDLCRISTQQATRKIKIN